MEVECIPKVAVVGARVGGNVAAGCPHVQLKISRCAILRPGCADMNTNEKSINAKLQEI